MPTPASTNALVLRRSAPSIPAENITTLTRLAHNRMLAQARSNACSFHPLTRLHCAGI